MAKHSVSALDLSLSPLAPPLKHPAFASIEELQNLKLKRQQPLRHKSIPSEWQTSGYVSYTEGGENAAFKSPFHRRGSLTNSARRAYRGGIYHQQPANSEESDSSLEPRRSSSEQWSSSCTFLSTSGVPTPQIRKRHMNCLTPNMENTNKRKLHKSPSTDSGTSSVGGSFPRIRSKSPSRKSQGSVGSASTTSSGSLGSLREKLEKTEPVVLEKVVKKRSSLASLINRKNVDKKISTSSTASNEDEGIEVKSGPSSPVPPPLSPSVRPAGKVSSSIRESLKAAKNALRRSSSNSKLNQGDRSFAGSNTQISALEFDETAEINDYPDGHSQSVYSATPPPKPLRTNSYMAVEGEGDNERIKSEISTSSSATLPATSKSKNKDMTEKSSTLPLGIKSGKKAKDGSSSLSPEPTKTPTKTVFGKLFGKNKSRTQDMPASLEQQPLKQSSKLGKSKSSSPDIVDLESEPRKLVPKGKPKQPRVVLTVDKNFKGISEMEVSEEAVELAKKLRELQRQAEEHNKTREEETKSLREVVIVGRDEEVTPPPGHNDEDGGYHESDETVKDVSLGKNTNKTGGKKIIRANGTTLLGFGSPPSDDTPKGRVGEIVADHQKYLPTMQSTPGRSSDEDYSNDRRNNSSCSRHEFESGIGNESPTSSLEEHLENSNISHHNQSDYGHYDEAEADEEDTSLATTITTTASEMDASFMLSRSLALTEEDFSYTESFKQLKPFNFDHVDPIPEGKRERLYKVLVVGELGTGKTSIIKRYVHQFFSQHYRATIGVDFALKVLRWDPETVVRLQLWDIAGQERFGSMTRVYYKEAVGAFVVFDVTRAATLEAVPKWKADLDAKVVLPDGRPIPTVLLANKSDQPKEGIAANRDKMNEFCQQQGFSAWFQTSAKDNINIDESANFLVSKILEMDKWSQEPMANDPEKLDLAANGKHRGGGDSNCAC